MTEQVQDEYRAERLVEAHLFVRYAYFALVSSLVFVFLALVAGTFFGTVVGAFGMGFAAAVFCASWAFYFIGTGILRRLGLQV